MLSNTKMMRCDEIPENVTDPWVRYNSIPFNQRKIVGNIIKIFALYYCQNPPPWFDPLEWDKCHWVDPIPRGPYLPVRSSTDSFRCFRKPESCYSDCLPRWCDLRHRRLCLAVSGTAWFHHLGNKMMCQIRLG